MAPHVGELCPLLLVKAPEGLFLPKRPLNLAILVGAAVPIREARTKKSGVPRKAWRIQETVQTTDANLDCVFSKKNLV